MNIEKAIEKEKRKLVERVRTKGLYENFGQREVRKLQDKFVNISSYSSEMKAIREKINQFDEWCMGYTG